MNRRGFLGRLAALGSALLAGERLMACTEEPRPALADLSIAQKMEMQGDEWDALLEDPYPMWYPMLDGPGKPFSLTREEALRAYIDFDAGVAADSRRPLLVNIHG